MDTLGNSYKNLRRNKHWMKQKLCTRRFGWRFLWSRRAADQLQFAVLPYIKGLTEPLKRRLKPHGMRVSKKPLHTLEQSFLSNKHKPSPENRTNVMYKIDCADCSWSYIGETAERNTRRKEHKRNVQHNKICSNIATNAWINNHSIDFNNGKIIDKGNYRHRRIFESWHTACTKNSDNNLKHLPEQYRFLLRKDH